MKIRLPMGNFKQNNNNLFLEQTKLIKIRIQNGNLTQKKKNNLFNILLPFESSKMNIFIMNK